MAKAPLPSYVGNPPATPGKPVVQTFPTPNLDDRIYSMRVDTRKGGFVMPEQGDAYSGPNADKYTGFVFATAKPVDAVGWVDLFYLNERENEDDYNFEVSYPWADRDYPQYTRTYVVLRDDTRANEPQADSLDPVHNDLYLIDHKWMRLQDPVLDALFIGIQRVYERLPSPVLTDYEVNQYQQVATIETQEVVGSPDVPTPSATTEAWKTEGDTTAKSKITISSVDSVFPENRYHLEREDRILPFKFRTKNPMETDTQTVAGTAVIPTLAQDDWMAEEHQITEFKKTVMRSFRSATLPITLIDYKLDNNQRVITITDTWDNGLQTITPTADLVDASVSNLGNDESIQSLSTVDGPFQEGDYSTRIPDLVPEKFRAAIPITTVAETSVGTADLEILSVGELEHREEQRTAFWKRTTSTGRSAASLPITLVEYKLTDNKQVETISETYDTGQQPFPSVDELTIEADVENLGNGTSLLHLGTVEELFTDAKYGKRIPDVVPERFRVAVPTATTSLLSAGTAAPPTLGSGDLSVQEDQVNVFVKRTTTENRSSVSLPVTLISTKLTPQKQLEIVVETLDTGLQTFYPSVDETTVEAEVQNLGDGTSLLTFGGTTTLFDPVQYEKSRPEVFPERFRAAIPLVSERHRVAGTASSPSLGDSDVRKSEEQVTVFVKETETSTRDLDSPPTLEGQDYDQALDVVVPYTEGISPAGTYIGTNRYEVTPLGNGFDLYKTFDADALNATLGDFLISFPGTANLQLPDVLEGIEGFVETTAGDGTYDESGFAGFTVIGDGGGAASLSLRGTGQASAAIIPDLAIDIRQIWANNIPTTHYLFFLPLPVTAADVITRLTELVGETVLNWPLFSPLAHTFTLVGQRLSLQCTASSNWHEGGFESDSGSGGENAYSSGTGYSQEVGLTVRTIRVPPTIHGAINLTGITSERADITADAHAEASVAYNAYIQRQGSVEGSISPTSLPATTGDSDIPTDGLRIKQIDAEPYRWGWARVHAEVVDFADIFTRGTIGGGGGGGPRLVENMFLTFGVKITSEELGAAGTSADYVHLTLGTLRKIGFRYNFDDEQWELYLDGGDTAVFPQTVTARWYNISLKISSNGNVENTMSMRINNVLGGNIITLPAGAQFDRVQCGAIYTTGTVNKRYIHQLQVGTTGIGTVDLFDGAMDGSVVPPYDSRTGVGVSSYNDVYLLTENGGTDAYAEFQMPTLRLP